MTELYNNGFNNEQIDLEQLEELQKVVDLLMN